uniref:Multifunctional methyltransferase subunit TRM112-like protein n=1 Tax=Erythrolobus australicus TaxID=1077150 RepID=A0A7S1TL27_9RHOD|mmetsp:Transcript_1889/g.5008  ORF Transcript_1889/g.5008 Transcript_1889/m.5008 type:complete len:196 (+) Transcript_1889:236-823(+)
MRRLRRAIVASVAVAAVGISARSAWFCAARTRAAVVRRVVTRFVRADGFSARRTMRLLTHNMLQCPRSGLYPLKLVPTELETIESEYNRAFIVHMLPRLDWPALRTTAAELALGELPENPPDDVPANDAVFELLHTILMDTHVKEGTLYSADGTSQYPIRNSIPNMLLNNTAATATASAPSAAAAPSSQTPGASS